MNNKMEEFLNTIGIDENNMSYFNNSNIEKVLINKDTNRFHFIFKIENTLPLKVYIDLKNAMQESFHHEITISINYTNKDEKYINEYINKLMEEYTKKEARYGIFKDRIIEQKDKIIKYPVYNKIEQINISNIKKELENKLKNIGFDIKLEIDLKQEEENNLLEKIEQEKIVDIIPK